ncbi:caspase family protein [Nostoc sp. FACHB-973]|nr:caspase family protein [Nostoc sp. FACHB-973]
MSNMDEKIQYYLIACGTSNYKHYDENKNLPSVKEDIKTVINLFTNNFGYKRVLPDLDLNPKKDDITLKFGEWLQDKERSETDRVIFYYSGHGIHYGQDKHYLLMEDTKPKQISETSLPTQDIVRPLNNKEIKIGQILYIIDTCHSGLGAGEITGFASEVIEKYKPVEGTSIPVHAIAACSAKQTAQEGLFSKALNDAVKKLSEGVGFATGGYIDLESLVGEINKNFPYKSQRAEYKLGGTWTSNKFFPVLPKTLQTWEEKRHEFVEELLYTLNKKLENSLFVINSFLLSSKLIEEFVLNERDLKEKLKKLSFKPVSDGICPLIACSEWCRFRFSDHSDTNKFNPTLAQEIENWQTKVIKYREEINLDRIEQFVNCNFELFKSKIKTEELRIQLEIQPAIDEETNTGLSTGSFLLNMNLWIESEKLPLGRFAENKVLDLRRIEEDAFEEDSNGLRICLEKENFLSDLIRQARYSLPERVKPKIEIFLPLDLYQESLENICFLNGRKQKSLGNEYQIFINSFERYFDKDFREICDDINDKKTNLWNHDNKPDSEIYYIGTEPSKSDLQMIEETKVIAVWSRNNQKPLVEEDEGHIKISEWKNWPDKIHNLRRQHQDLEVTLFWDDLYPKPSRRSILLKT